MQPSGHADKLRNLYNLLQIEVEDEVVNAAIRIQICFDGGRSGVFRVLADIVVRALSAIDGPPVQQEQIGIVMSFKLLERFAYGDERTQGATAIFSHSKGREGEPSP